MAIFGHPGGLDFDEKTAYRYITNFNYYYIPMYLVVFLTIYTYTILFPALLAHRDVFHQSTCDEGCLELARLLGLDVREFTLDVSCHQKQ